ncbi:adenylate kinase [Tolypothrix sp. FACHB-123]|uniref:adenylate kinase n=1 Tax=Tolypothrix sp. FACHB-123 TaxID=2692868 RepID=UPI00168619C2|nr:adenylate kinase [Tolypothrix sp. FACHB-123]MBD2358638.1 adenylate kinase [Tolypothrix sp. FACHB-123]
MKKVAVFGNAGGGKSTLSQRLSEITGLPLYILDKILYQSGDAKIPESDYQRIHQEILVSNCWIIDGFGSIETLWPRLNEADSLVFVDLPLYVHFWWVTKRFIGGYFKPPAGWPENSPILRSSLNSYRVLWLCHKYLTPKYRQYIAEAESSKNVYHLRSPQEIGQFLQLMENKIK